jgi:hypothetical protein
MERLLCQLFGWAGRRAGIARLQIGFESHPVVDHPINTDAKVL